MLVHEWHALSVIGQGLAALSCALLRSSSCLGTVAKGQYSSSTFRYAALQEEQRTEADLADLAGSAQLHAQLRILGVALQTAQLDPAQFGLDARVRRAVP